VVQLLTMLQGKSTHKSRTRKEEKIFLEINPQFGRSSRGGRSGRGGEDRLSRGDGGRSRGVPKSRLNGAGPVNVDDESVFPSLS
jgi:hypothetical protein